MFFVSSLRSEEVSLIMGISPFTFLRQVHFEMTVKNKGLLRDLSIELFF